MRKFKYDETKFKQMCFLLQINEDINQMYKKILLL